MERVLKIDDADLALSRVPLHAVRKGLLKESDAMSTSRGAYFGHSDNS